MTSPKSSAEEDFARGFHGIPDDEKLTAMSFAELASELSSCDEGTPKFIVIEREIKKHLAQDQSKINRKNVIIGGVMAGLFGLSGVVLGWWLRDSSSMQYPSSGSSEHQLEQSKFGENAKITNVIPAFETISSEPIAVPDKVENNAQPSN